MPRLLIGSATGQGRRPSETDRCDSEKLRGFAILRWPFQRSRLIGTLLQNAINSATKRNVLLPAKCNGMLPPSAITKGCAKSHPRRRRAVAQPGFDQDLVGVRRWRVR